MAFVDDFEDLDESSDALLYNWDYSMRLSRLCPIMIFGVGRLGMWMWSVFYCTQSAQSAAHKHGGQMEQLQRRVEVLQADISNLDIKLGQTIEHFKSVELGKLRRQVVLQKLIDAVIEVINAN